ncbi:MAG: acetylglutamate kinase [Bacteroidota bacterium]
MLINTLNILKIGGKVLEDEQQLDQALSYFSQLPQPAILVHGGGKKASEMSQKLGIQPKMINGRRITDADALEVVTMIYAGLSNKKVVSQLQAKGCNALGISGADGNIILSQKRVVRDIDYGFAGDIVAVNTIALCHLLNAGFVPVCCAITHNKRGQLLNTNADTIAAELAIALADDYEVCLQYCFEKPGVLMDAEDDTSVIPTIQPDRYQQLKADGIIYEGMIPKLDNAFAAIEAGVKQVSIGNLKALTANEATILNA